MSRIILYLLYLVAMNWYSFYYKSLAIFEMCCCILACCWYNCLCIKQKGKKWEDIDKYIIPIYSKDLYKGWFWVWKPECIYQNLLCQPGCKHINFCPTKLMNNIVKNIYVVMYFIIRPLPPILLMSSWAPQPDSLAPVYMT